MERRNGGWWLGIAIAAALPAAAQEDGADADGGGLSEVIVTARKVEESLQEVPIAVSAFSEEQLQQLDVQSATGMGLRVPNFLSPRNTVSSSAPQFYMRGVGRAENNWNFENAIAVFVDDVYLQSTAGAYVDMVDIERVEVLRGPQGTLYGRNATTGALKFVPRRPRLDGAETRASVTFGSNERIDLKAAHSRALVENVLGVKFEAYRTANNGYLTQVDATGAEVDDSVDEREHYGGRLALLWNATDDVEVEFAADIRRERNGTNLITPIVPVAGELFSKDGSARFAPFFGDPHRVGAEARVRGDGTTFDGEGVVGKLRWDTGFGVFKSITAWRQYEDTYDSQLSGFPFPLAIPVPPAVFPPGVIHLSTYIDSYNDYEQLTQEFQFTGSVGERFDYTAGLYWFQNDWTQVQFVGPLIPQEFNPPNGGAVNDTFQDATSYAAYFDATVHLTDRIDLFFGGRWTLDEKKVTYLTRTETQFGGFPFPGFPVNPREDWDAFTPRVGAEFALTDDIRFYASYSEGYKSGFLQGARTVDPLSASRWLDPEIVENLEFGVKADWLDGRLRTNVTGFLSTLNDKADIFFAAGSATAAVDAATADVDIDGIEAEIAFAPIDPLLLYANVGWLDARYVRADANHPIFERGGNLGTQPAPGLDASPVSTPEYTVSVGGNYTWFLEGYGSLTLAGNLQAVDDHYGGLGVENNDSEIVEAYEVLGANLTWRSPDERYAVTLGGDNLADAEYWTTSFFGDIPGRSYADGRTFFLTLSFTQD